MKGVKGIHKGIANRDSQGHYSGQEARRRAVGYVRVSTDMQAAEGLSLEAQQSAIESYCSMHGIKLVKLCKDVMSGGKDVRPGLTDALRTLQSSADVLIVLKFDRLSRSIKHFCELYETYFKDGTKELVAIRESIRLDSSLGRALVGILLVFAQMEREATGERTKEAISYIRRSGYHFGKAPYGKRAIPAPDNPRRRILVEDDVEQAVISLLKEWALDGVKPTEMAKRLNAQGVPPPQGKEWTMSLVYNLRLRLHHILPRPHNERPYSDADVRERILALRAHGHTLRQIASILNEQGWIPVKGNGFTERNVCGLLKSSEASRVMTPKQYLHMMQTKMQQAHETEHPGEPFESPSLSELASLLEEAGFLTPRGHSRWWPAQVQQALAGKFERYYRQQRASVMFDAQSCL